MDKVAMLVELVDGNGTKASWAAMAGAGGLPKSLNSFRARVDLPVKFGRYLDLAESEMSDSLRWVPPRLSKREDAGLGVEFWHLKADFAGVSRCFKKDPESVEWDLAGDVSESLGTDVFPAEDLFPGATALLASAASGSGGDAKMSEFLARLEEAAIRAACAEPAPGPGAVSGPRL